MEEFIQNNLGNGTAQLVCAWASKMEGEVKKERKVIDVASSTLKELEGYDYTGYMLSCALNVLFNNWKYGEELKKWYLECYK